MSEAKAGLTGVRCTSCGKTVKPGELLYADERGGFWCRECSDTKAQLERHVRIRAQEQLHTRVWQFLALSFALALVAVGTLYVLHCMGVPR